MSVSVYVREITKWGRLDRRDCARTCQQQTELEEAYCFGPGPKDLARRPGIRVVVGGISTDSGTRQIIPKTTPDPEKGIES